jgi:hypothetical protein
VIVKSNTFKSIVFAVSNVESFSIVNINPLKYSKDLRELIPRDTGE